MNVITQSEVLKRLPKTLYKLGAQSWIDYDYPRHIFIETTSSCNLTCAYCPREDRMDHMDFPLFQSIVDEATHYGPRSFSLHLFGEPTLYPKWLDAVAYIKRRHARHTILLTTNGTTLNRRVDDLITSGVDLVLWTWRPEAAFTPETKEKLRRWGKFRVRFIKEITPQEAYAEWADWPNIEGRNLHNYAANIDLSLFTSPESNVPAADSKGISSRYPCYHLWLAPAVAWNGNILLCCADPHQKEVLGHFPEVSVHEAWTGFRLRSIREGHLRGSFTGICKGCDVWKQYPDLFFSWQKRSSS